MMNTSMPLVSIIVPIYNVEQYLAECLESLVNQTLQDIEIICVNDASLDKSKDIAEQYAMHDSRVRVVSHVKNRGLGPARNTGVENATAPYIMFVDSDDVVTTNMAEKLYSEMISKHVDMVWCNIGGMSDDGAIRKKGTEIPIGVFSPTDILADSQLYQILLPSWNKLYKKELIHDVKQMPIVSEDQPFLAVVLGRCERISVIADTLYYYRNRQGTLSKPKLHTAKSWDAFFYSHQLFFELLPNTIGERAIKMQCIKRYFSLFWRIYTFKLTTQDTWQEQQQSIYKHLKQNEIPIKSNSQLLYWYLCYVFGRLRPQTTTKTLVHFGMDWSTYMSRHGEMYKVLAYLLKRIGRLMITKIFSLIDNLEQRVVRLLSRFINKDIWLIGERTNTYQDNGMYFFKYLQKNHPEIDSYYVINRDYLDLVDSKNVLVFNSLKHKLYFSAAKVYANSHYDAAYPRTCLTQKRYRMASKTQNVFLQHGITYSDVSQYYGKATSDINMFVCAVPIEKTVAVRDFGYQDDETPLTGFARFDGLNDANAKSQILLMPTWRRSLQDFSNGEFVASEYFKRLKDLLSSEWLQEFLQKHDMCLKFAPHYEMTPYLYLFEDLKDGRIDIVNTSQVSVQTLLKESALLITDVSSVQFDFAYMQKPIIYYQWDYEEITKAHLGKGYFNFDIDGFGPICKTLDALKDTLESVANTNWQMSADYIQRVDAFFKYRDTKNCERIYNARMNGL